MRRAIVCVAALVLGLPTDGYAQVRSFPYEAVVETDGVPVHCGPGFYATNRLKRGERVVVHRHDPGGWSMISPPDGEFSLISTAAVQADASGQAVVAVDETTVRVGSRLSGEYGVEQVPLARGTRIAILQGVTPPAGWLAIQPPRGEYRWIQGRYLVPVQPTVRSAQDADPFSVPTNAKRPDVFDAAAEVESTAPLKETPGPALTLGPVEEEPVLADATEALRMLDRELEGLHLFEPTEWPLDELAAEYRSVKANKPSMGRQIDVRLAQIEKMRLVREHYSDYVRLTSATDERDAALVARHRQIAGGVVQASEPNATLPEPTLAPPMRLTAKPAATGTPLPPPAPPAEPIAAAPAMQVQPSLPSYPPVRPAAPTPQSAGPQLLPPVPDMTPDAANMQTPYGPQIASGPVPSGSIPPGGPAPQQPTPAGPQRFDAIGIVQAAVDPPPEAPNYVLVAPDGRIVVYLQEQPGLPLEKFVGQAMGVDGERHRHPEMATPMIVVRKLTPVRF